MTISLLNGSRSLFYQMDCDIYYASESQDSYGKIVKTWEFDMVEQCSFYTLGDTSNSNNLVFEDKKFMKLENMLYGRFKTDPRQALDGSFHPISHILVSNIRGATCNTETFFIETNGEYVGKPTIYEIKTCQPFIGPFNTVEYFKIQLERSDHQGWFA
jgi:hypothetical protein